MTDDSSAPNCGSENRPSYVPPLHNSLGSRTSRTSRKSRPTKAAPSALDPHLHPSVASSVARDAHATIASAKNGKAPATDVPVPGNCPAPGAHHALERRPFPPPPPKKPAPRRVAHEENGMMTAPITSLACVDQRASSIASAPGTPLPCAARQASALTVMTEVSMVLSDVEPPTSLPACAPRVTAPQTDAAPSSVVHGPQTAITRPLRIKAPPMAQSTCARIKPPPVPLPPPLIVKAPPASVSKASQTDVAPQHLVNPPSMHRAPPPVGMAPLMKSPPRSLCSQRTDDDSYSALSFGEIAQEPVRIFAAQSAAEIASERPLALGDIQQQQEIHRKKPGLGRRKMQVAAPPMEVVRPHVDAIAQQVDVMPPQVNAAPRPREGDGAAQTNVAPQRADLRPPHAPSPVKAPPSNFKQLTNSHLYNRVASGNASAQVGAYNGVARDHDLTQVGAYDTVPNGQDLTTSSIPVPESAPFVTNHADVSSGSSSTFGLADGRNLAGTRGVSDACSSSDRLDLSDGRNLQGTRCAVPDLSDGRGLSLCGIARPNAARGGHSTDCASMPSTEYAFGTVPDLSDGRGLSLCDTARSNAARGSRSTDCTSTTEYAFGTVPDLSDGRGLALCDIARPSAARGGRSTDCASTSTECARGGSRLEPKVPYNGAPSGSKASSPYPSKGHRAVG